MSFWFTMMTLNAINTHYDMQRIEREQRELQEKMSKYETEKNRISYRDYNTYNNYNTYSVSKKMDSSAYNNYLSYSLDKLQELKKINKQKLQLEKSKNTISFTKKEMSNHKRQITRLTNIRLKIDAAILTKSHNSNDLAISSSSPHIESKDDSSIEEKLKELKKGQQDLEKSDNITIILYLIAFLGIPLLGGIIMTIICLCCWA